MNKFLLLFAFSFVTTIILYYLLKNRPNLMFFFSVFVNVLSITTIFIISQPNLAFNKNTVR